MRVRVRDLLQVVVVCRPGEVALQDDDIEHREQREAGEPCDRSHAGGELEGDEGEEDP